jgi:hypothetical protein
VCVPFGESPDGNEGPGCVLTGGRRNPSQEKGGLRRVPKQLISDAAFVTGLIMFMNHANENFHPSGNVSAAMGIFAGGAVAFLVGAGSHNQAERQLEQAIAFYNRSLPDTP